MCKPPCVGAREAVFCFIIVGNKTKIGNGGTPITWAEKKKIKAKELTCVRCDQKTSLIVIVVRRDCTDDPLLGASQKRACCLLLPFQRYTNSKRLSAAKGNTRTKGKKKRDEPAPRLAGALRFRPTSSSSSSSYESPSSSASSPSPSIGSESYSCGSLRAVLLRDDAVGGAYTVVAASPIGAPGRRTHSGQNHSPSGMAAKGGVRHVW